MRMSWHVLYVWGANHMVQLVVSPSARGCGMTTAVVAMKGEL